MPFPTFAEYPIPCKKPYRKSNNMVRCLRSDNLLIVPFCLRGAVPDESVFVREGILGLYARARSGRVAVLRKIFLAPFGRSVFFAKILS